MKRSLMTVDKKIVSKIILNQNLSDPSAMLSGDINGDAIKWIRDNSHCYLAKHTGVGEMTVCQLSDLDRKKFYDGSVAVLTGSEGSVFMKLPTFYYHAKEVSSDIWEIEFANYKVSDTWKTYKEQLIAVYLSIVLDNTVYSVSGATPTLSSNSNWLNYVNNMGLGFTGVDFRNHCIMAFLFYAMYGTTNSQAVIGNGTINTHITGSTDNLGMEDTKSALIGNNPINFWGLEDWWGYYTDIVQGLTKNNQLLTIVEHDGTTRTLNTAPISDPNVVPSKIVIGEYLDLIGKQGQPDASKGYCDYMWNSSAPYNRFHRSFYHPPAPYYNGVGCIRGYTNDTSSGYSFRLVFRGNIIEAKDIQQFKSIITN
ncbi:hypothetical protein [Parabacteroides provencensis]|uniref:hypothetical protein n=1 Tax=Parabacteroides provencensis TaxID=1944636 RepID=UPI00118157C7|nr:hypothetical protein [Parabacteroides provencensis]